MNNVVEIIITALSALIILLGNLIVIFSVFVYIQTLAKKIMAITFTAAASCGLLFIFLARLWNWF